MRYDDTFHQFIEMMMERLGYTPNHYKHHVFARNYDIIGFAYFDEERWRWIVPSVYYKLSLDSLEVMVDSLDDEIQRYCVDHPDLLEPRPMPQPIGGREAFQVIQDAKNSDDFDDQKWGDEDGS